MKHASVFRVNPDTKLPEPVPKMWFRMKDILLAYGVGAGALFAFAILFATMVGAFHNLLDSKTSGVINFGVLFVAKSICNMFKDLIFG